MEEKEIQKNSNLITAQSFKINLNQVEELTTEDILKLSNAQLSNNQSLAGKLQDIQIIQNTIRSKPGKYNIVLGIKNAEGNLETITIEVTVKNRKKLFLLLSLIGLLILLGGVLLYNSGPKGLVSELPDATTEKMTTPELKKYLNQKFKDNSVSVQVYPKVYIQSDGKTGKMYVQNIPTNKYGQVASLQDKTTGETLCSTKLIKPGYQVSKINLRKKLSKGDHEGLVILNMYDLKDRKKVSTVNINVTISVTG